MDWHQYFTYDAKIGSLMWKERINSGYPKVATWNTRYANKKAGQNQMAYGGRTRMCIQVSVSGKKHKAHRIIWEMHNGPIPNKMVIDHCDGNPWNNLLDNLRMVTQSQNCFNTKSKNTKRLLPRGVRRSHKSTRFHAGIYVNKTRVHLGTFDTPDEAHLAYLEAVEKYHGEFSFNKHTN